MTPYLTKEEMFPREVKVIKQTYIKGSDTVEDPLRKVTAYYELNGRLIHEEDYRSEIIVLDGLFETVIANFKTPEQLGHCITAYNQKQRLIIDYDPAFPNKAVIRRQFGCDNQPQGRND